MNRPGFAVNKCHVRSFSHWDWVCYVTPHVSVLNFSHFYFAPYANPASQVCLFALAFILPCCFASLVFCVVEVTSFVPRVTAVVSSFPVFAYISFSIFAFPMSACMKYFPLSSWVKYNASKTLVEDLSSVLCLSMKHANTTNYS